MTPERIDLDLFAGPGSWDEGRRHLGETLPLEGIEWDRAACDTAEAAGHARVCADVTTQPIDHYRHRVRGLIASPTCRGWSLTGPQGGQRDRPLVHELLAAHAVGQTAPPRQWADERSQLTAEPMRWIHALRPEWIALEQVPAVLSLWQHFAVLLRGLRYSSWCGVVQADRYGVPSTRRRAVLLARRVGTVGEPFPTHLRPVTMGEALGLDDGRVLVSNYGTGGDPKRRGRRTLDEPAPTMTGKCGRNRWLWPDGSSRNLTVPEAGVLQGFRSDYPWTGNLTQQQQQVGDAVPPPLAAALLAQVITPSAVGVARRDGPPPPGDVQGLAAALPVAPAGRPARAGGMTAPTRRGTLTIVPTFRDEAFAFIRRFHRHHPPPTGYLFAVAVANANGQIVGVGIVGRPTSFVLQADGWTCEVTRTCTDGTPNANSALYGAVWRAGRALGYRRAITYNQDDESGVSLRAAGWRLVVSLPPRPGWDSPSRPRVDAHPTGVGRGRWEITADLAPWSTRPRVESQSTDAPGLWEAP